MDRCTDGCAKGSENRSGLVWHDEGEGLKSCGKPVSCMSPFEY